jgi:hypothetical protein
MKRKLISLAMFISVLVSSTIFLTGCNPKEYTDGYFTYKFANKSKTQVEISGLSKLGRQQRFIVIPEEINGAEVIVLADRYLFGTGAADFRSDYLEKIFFQTRVWASGIRTNSLYFNQSGIKLFVINLPENYEGGGFNEF